MYNYLMVFILLFCVQLTTAQTIQDDFEGNGTITTWGGDDCGINTNYTNPHQTGINTSSTVLEYNDNGGLYANVKFDAANNFDLSTNYTFSIKIFVPSSGLTGNQNNQVSLKLQDGTLGEPWSTQSEIIKPIAIDQWQTISFDFLNDPYLNLNGDSPPPTQRTDFNRVLIQINGENNNDFIIAYIDDFYYNGTVPVGPVFDNLVWSDEFDDNGAIDATKWFHQTQLPAGGSWYNGEIQHYTDRTDNSFVEDGILKIVAKKENYTDQGHTKQYTSARLNSKFAFKYGRLEIRAKLPTGVGTWPAIWTLGKNINEDGGYWDTQGFDTTPWPACGEIDIMEHWGYNQNYVQSATHTPSSHGATMNLGGQTVSTASSEFHVYAVEWTAEKMVFSVDNAVHYTYNPVDKNADTWPFDAEQYFLLNIAIQPEITPSFTEGAMEVDYVRIYQESLVSTVEISEESPLLYYPNPMDNQLTININAADQIIPIKIYNFEGKLLKNYRKSVNDNTVTLNDMGDLSTGIYVVSYILEGKTYSFKIVKK